MWWALRGYWMRTGGLIVRRRLFVSDWSRSTPRRRRGAYGGVIVPRAEAVLGTLNRA